MCSVSRDVLSGIPRSSFAVRKSMPWTSSQEPPSGAKPPPHIRSFSWWIKEDSKYTYIYIYIIILCIYIVSSKNKQGIQVSLWFAWLDHIWLNLSGDPGSERYGRRDAQRGPPKKNNKATVEMICINKKMQERSVRRPSELEGTKEIHWGHVRDIWEMEITILCLLCFSQTSVCWGMERIWEGKTRSGGRVRGWYTERCHLFLASCQACGLDLFNPFYVKM